MEPASPRPQTTLATALPFEGAGLHSGAPCRATIEPAAADHGLVLEAEGERIAVAHASLCEKARCTGLGARGVQVLTVEHALAALHGLGVDNALIRVEGGEMPILDGSAQPFVEAIRAEGIVELPATTRAVLRLARPVFVETGGSRAVALPSERLRFTVAVRFPAPVGCQTLYLSDAYGEFALAAAPARTPGFLREWEALKARGLALGAREGNVLPILDDCYGAPLRMPLEVAAHKALDLMGDLALVGREIRAHIITTLGSHALNQQLGAEMLRTVTA